MQYRSLVIDKRIAQLSDCVRLRKEYFGGIVFNADTGDILEVDHEAFNLLERFRAAETVDINSLLKQEGLRSIITTLIDMNIIVLLPEKAPGISLYPFPINAIDISQNLDIKDSQILSAPETVHLAVTYRCDESCPDCYSREFSSITSPEIDTLKMYEVIDKIADGDVFQLAIGGGEPFMRSDLSDIAARAARKGLVTHITTGQYTLKPQWDDVLKYIKSLHVGIRTEDLLNNAEERSTKLKKLVELVTQANVSIGANLIITRFMIRYIDKLVELLLKCGFKRLIFLRYKPIANRDRWSGENPSGMELKDFGNFLTYSKSCYPGIMIRVDCAAAFLMRNLDPPTAKYAGIGGCSAGNRIVSVAPDGSLFPCSQLVGREYYAGNLLSDSFKNIWYGSEVLDKYRFFRQSALFSGSVCGGCVFGAFCGGCRVYASDKTGIEPFCPM